MPSKSKAADKLIYAADSETDPFKKGRVPQPFIWGAYNIATGDYDSFTDTAEFVEFMADQDCICYIHNGGKFDFHFITNFISDWEPLTIINGRLAKFRIGQCEFRDSLCIIPAPLSAYQKEEIDYAIFEESEREKPENWGKITAYLESDCRYLGEMIAQFIANYGLHLTQASAALKNWEKISGIKKPKTSSIYYDEMSEFYYGGRVECFTKGIINEPFSVIDIKSAYPFAMMHKHPWGQMYTFAESIDGWNDEKISRSFITLRADATGAFPVRSKTGIDFPNDGMPREFAITGWEYLAARDTGTLKNDTVISVRYYYETISFEEYVNHFFDMKAEADRMLKSMKPTNEKYGYWAATRLFAKIFLNSLYGKFASNPENYEEFMTIPASDMQSADELDGWKFCKLISADTGVITRPLPEEKHRYYDVAVAASVTGFVRAYLWRAIQSCDNVLYCDTDSIACGQIGDVNIGPNLGDWELEAECDHGAIAGKKLYAFHKKKYAPGYENQNAWKIASKGVRLNAAEIVKIAKGERVTYEPEVPTFSIKNGIKFTPRSIERK